jgi:hypothetical protein
MRFTALLHHVYDLYTLRTACLRLKGEAAAGVDGETWRHYGERLEENLRDLADRLKRGAYRAKPVRRVYIARNDGGNGRYINATMRTSRQILRYDGLEHDPMCDIVISSYGTIHRTQFGE